VQDQIAQAQQTGRVKDSIASKLSALNELKK
jgi:hypothetical protein